MTGVPVFDTVAGLRAWIAAERGRGQRIGLVPTMGALHAGHLSLVDCARGGADAVIVSIFVNPLQFGPKEDFGAYPRQLEADARLCAAAGVGAVFAPRAEAMYPTGFETHVEVERLTTRWCGESRPGHFRGVTTVVLKLLNAALADVAVFGEKDWQQLQAIRRMARDLDHPTAIVGAPIVREPDGLAMSSRNAYLDAADRARALAIPRSVQAAREAVAGGQRDAATITAEVARAIATAGGRVDYAAVVDPDSLEPVATIAAPARLLVAAHFGRTRLLDNIALQVGNLAPPAP